MYYEFEIENKDRVKLIDAFFYSDTHKMLRYKRDFRSRLVDKLLEQFNVEK